MKHIFAYFGGRKRPRKPYACNDNHKRHAAPVYYNLDTHGHLRSIPGFSEDFMVSEKGFVVKGRRVLRGWVNRKGYKRVTIRKDGRDRNYFVHKLVALAWIGERPDGFHVDHINFDTGDNRPVNLRYLPARINTVRRRKP